MCLLIFKPEGKTIPTEYLKNAHQSNPHGCGVAVAKNGKIKIDKSSRWTADEIGKVLKENTNAPAIVHFRWATHGSKNFMNTHPFQLNDSWVAAHNGVIPNMDTEDDESDTRAFLRQHVIPLLDVGVRLDDKDILTMLGKSMGSGNKMTFLSADGSFGIANETSGHWKDGVWYSNHSYLETSSTSRVWIPASRRNRSSDYAYHGYHGGRGGWDWDGECGEAYCDDPPFRRKKGATHPMDDEDDDLTEAWHTFNITQLYCDNCNRRVIDEFRIESRSGLCYCHSCYDQI